MRATLWPVGARRGAITPLVAALGAFALVATACASGAHLDTAAAERQIDAKLATYYEPAKVSDTVCPPRVGLRKGATFTCTTRVEGSPVGVTVTQVDDKGAVTFAPTSAVIEVATTTKDLRAKLAALYSRDGAVASVKVDCGTAKVRVLAPKASFTCNVTVGTQHFKEAVTVEDVVGHVSYRPLDGS